MQDSYNECNKLHIFDRGFPECIIKSHFILWLYLYEEKISHLDITYLVRGLKGDYIN